MNQQSLSQRTAYAIRSVFDRRDDDYCVGFPTRYIDLDDGEFDTNNIYDFAVEVCSLLSASLHGVGFEDFKIHFNGVLVRVLFQRIEEIGLEELKIDVDE